MFSDDIDQMIILLVSSLLAMLSFMAVALPFLNRSEKKERYKNIIEKKRKALFEQAKERVVYKGEKETTSVRESLVFFFKIQQVFGAMGEKARDQMLQAGIRDPEGSVCVFDCAWRYTDCADGFDGVGFKQWREGNGRQ